MSVADLVSTPRNREAARHSLTTRVVIYGLLVYGFDHGGAAGSGLIAVIQLVPAAMLTPFSSSLADRFPRARVLFAAYLVDAIGTAAAGVAIVLDWPFAVVGRDKDNSLDKAGKAWLVWSHAWCHTSVLQRRQQIARDG